jgi:tetratricopeptide (TPR) repeat protein
VIRRVALVALAAGLCASTPPADAQDPAAAAVGARALDAPDLASIPLDPEGHAQLAKALQAGAYDRAQALLLEAYGREPRSPALLRVLGGVLFLTGQDLDSAIALKKAEALEPLDARSRFTLAMAYVVMRQRRWARPELEALAAADPRRALYPYWLARLEYDEEHYAAAVDRFRQALALDPESAKAHDNLGLALDALGRYDEAIESHREALRLNRARGSHSPWPALNLGLVLTRLGRLDEAEALFRESAREDPLFARAPGQLGIVLEKRGRTAEAIASLLEAARLDPRYAEPHYVLARLYRRAGESEKADRALARFQDLKKEVGRYVPEAVPPR